MTLPNVGPVERATPRLPREGDPAHESVSRRPRKESAMRRSGSFKRDERRMMIAVEKVFRYGGKPSFTAFRTVAEEMGIAVPAVTILLHEAFRRGMFLTIIQLPQEKTEVPRLEDTVQSAYGLKKVLLVPGYGEMLDELSAQRRRNIHSQVILDMARRVAGYLDERLAAAGERLREAAQTGRKVAHFLVGVAWGRTMNNIACHLCSTRRPTRLPFLEVLPIVGTTCASNSSGVEANVVAMDVARAYGGSAAQLPCPAVVDALDASIASRLRQVRQVLAALKRVDIVVTGMGPVLENGTDEDMRLSNDPDTNALLVKAARAAGACGEICFWLWNKEGKEVKTDYEAVGLGYEGLREIAADPEREVILVAGGDARRLEPLRVALRAGLASVLVTDTITARYLVGEL
jgi:DNA-binding transcriptional regulator LsrR (DeoR family)